MNNPALAPYYRLVMAFNCKDADMELMRVGLFSKANNVILSAVKAWVGETPCTLSVSMEMIAHGIVSCDCS